jgi:hypothetical protein
VMQYVLASSSTSTLPRKWMSSPSNFGKPAGVYRRLQPTRSSLTAVLRTQAIRKATIGKSPLRLRTTRS